LQAAHFRPHKKIKGLKKKLLQILALERKSLQETLTSTEQANVETKQTVLDKLESLGISTNAIVEDFDSKQEPVAIDHALPAAIPSEDNSQGSVDTNIVATPNSARPSTTPKKKKYKKVGFDSILIAEALAPTTTPPVACAPFSWKSQNLVSKQPTFADIQKEELSKSAPSGSLFLATPPPKPSTTPQASPSAQVPDVVLCVTIKSKSKSQKTAKKAAALAPAPPAGPAWGNTTAATQPTSFASIQAEEAAKPILSYATNRNWANGQKTSTRRQTEPAKNTPKPLAKIQTEEKAMQQIASLYSKKGVFVDIKLATSL